jgi:hypothetical protein
MVVYVAGDWPPGVCSLVSGLRDAMGIEAHMLALLDFGLETGLGGKPARLLGWPSVFLYSMTMVGDTERLFLLLLRRRRSDVVCDIGSLDATHAKRFRRTLPRAHVIAFEAPPP